MMANTSGLMSRYLFPAGDLQNVQALIVCLPHAGGNLHTYHAWAAHLPSGIGLMAWQAPGRGCRIDEPILADLPAMTDEVVAGIKALETTPFVLFGHSFGGLLAFETARALRRAGQSLPAHFVASGCLPPPLTQARRSKYQGLDDNGAMFDRLVEDGGVPASLQPHREAFLPMMGSVRAEYQVMAQYCFSEETPLAIPLTLFCARDDRLVGSVEMAGWSALFDGDVDEVALEGDHFYVDAATAAQAAACYLGKIASDLLRADAGD
ncbi:Surfactin synthase thioesterase subunit [Pseudomonas sp. NFR09]|uniref:thioesterase II family protein n=1 Tax=Pseudomonas sp. NFR09 TaxID=1566249 RepID=UPI0008AC28E6|nr:alpha/beta fold hydrolase [Pseudomonas sp. NFR09]SET65041.1 Surfactin synthase thioesterase subunit [Pseudomonas sp. NFR09]